MKVHRCPHCGKPFLASEATLHIPSYDGIAIERTPDTASGREDEIVEHLRSLGYLEDDDAAATGPEHDPAPTAH